MELMVPVRWHTVGKSISLYGIFPETKQFSAYLDATRELKNGLNLGFTGAFDVGELYYDSYGVLVRVRKEW